MLQKSAIHFQMIKCFISKVEKAKLIVKRVMAMRGIHPGTSCIQGKAKSEFKRLSDMPGIYPGTSGMQCKAKYETKSYCQLWVSKPPPSAVLANAL